MKNIYTIYDKVAKKSGTLFQSLNHNTAIRDVLNLAKTSTMLVEHITLYYLGNYNDQTLEIETFDKIEIELIKMEDLMKRDSH